jgi:hypothetical protein
MVTGRWELKISNYGLENIRDSQMEIVQKPMNEQSTSSDESFPGVARVLRSTKTLFWLAPESVVATPLNEYLTFPTRQADVFR